MNTQAVVEHVERSKSLLEASPGLDEENTKAKLIQPLLELLGWDLYSTEVELEHTVPMASGRTRVDYALKVGGNPVVFVEAKPARSELSESELTQLRSYLRQDLDVGWGVLTNGMQFEVLRKGEGGNGEISVMSFDLNELADSPERLELLTKEAIQSGRADEIAEEVTRTKRAVEYLERETDEVSEAIASSVQEHVGDVPVDLEEQSRKFVRELASALREQQRFVAGTGDTTSTTGTDEPTGEELPKDGPPVISRSEFAGDSDDIVAVFPANPSGMEFLLENEAWGFVRVGQEFDFVAMYITGEEGTESAVRYVARAGDIVAPEEADLARPATEYREDGKIAEGKKVVNFEPGSLHELSDPILFESKYPQSLRYTTFGEFQSAETTDDIL